MSADNPALLCDRICVWPLSAANAAWRGTCQTRLEARSRRSTPAPPRAAPVWPVLSWLVARDIVLATHTPAVLNDDDGEEELAEEKKALDDKKKQAKRNLEDLSEVDEERYSAAPSRLCLLAAHASTRGVFS